MNCKICGYPLTGNDQFCKNCGTSVNNVTVPNNGVINPTPITQPTSNNLQQPVNNSEKSELLSAMTFVQPQESVQQPVNIQQEQNLNTIPVQQAVTTNMQPQQPNSIPTPQPVNSSPILEPNLNTIEQPVNIEQTLNSNQQIANNTVLEQQQNNSIKPEVSQNINTQAQPITNLNTNQQQETKKSKNNNLKFILIGVALVLLIAVVSVLLVTKFLNKDKEPTPNEEEQVVNKISNYTVKYAGFTFKIPTNLIYMEEENSLIVTDEEDTKAAYIEVMDGLYSQLSTKKNMLQGVYQEEGYEANAAKEETIGNVDFITLELTASGSNILLGFSKANSMKVFGITIYNLDNEYDYNFLETIANILTSAEYTGETNAIISDEKVNMSIISDLIKEEN